MASKRRNKFVPWTILLTGLTWTWSKELIFASGDDQSRFDKQPDREEEILSKPATQVPSPEQKSESHPASSSEDAPLSSDIQPAKDSDSLPDAPASPRTANENQSKKPVLPRIFPKPAFGEDRLFLPLGPNGTQVATTINTRLQEHLERFMESNGDPVGAVVVIEARTGKIRALVQGKSPQQWNSNVHTTVNPGFPAASIFKIVSATAAFEVGHLDSDYYLPFVGGCATVGPTGAWMKEISLTRSSGLTMRQAFGHSCNGFFAKLAVSQLGLGTIDTFARKYGWQTEIPADFYIPPSPLLTPDLNGASSQTAGMYAAGFGLVGLSPVHAAWLALIAANNGNKIPIQLVAGTDNSKLMAEIPEDQRRIFSASTSAKLKDVMAATLHGGTASSAFRRPKYRNIKEIAGGKTGTLNNHVPQGLATWFVGMMPLDNPEVVVASLVVNSDRWVIKASSLSAEALWAYQQLAGPADSLISANNSRRRTFRRH